MAPTALYGKKGGYGVFYKLNRAANRWISTPKKVFISDGEFRRLLGKSTDIEVRKDSVRAGADRVHPLLINIRVPSGNINGCNNIFYISPKELEGMGEKFKVPANVLSGAFFELRTDNHLNDASFQIRPIWTELLNPKWKEAFLAWVAGQGRLPSPKELKWQTHGEGRIAMPGMTPLLHLNDAKGKIIKGELSFKQVSDERIATFRYQSVRDIIDISFSLKPERVTPIIDNAGKEDIAPWNGKTFKGLFGKSPVIKTYTFAKKAGSTGMPLGNVGGASFYLKNAKTVFAFVQGKIYILRGSRSGSSVLVEVLSEGEARSPVAECSVALDEVAGLPLREGVTLHPVR